MDPLSEGIFSPPALGEKKCRDCVVSRWMLKAYDLPLRGLSAWFKKGTVPFRHLFSRKKQTTDFTENTDVLRGSQSSCWHCLLRAIRVIRGQLLQMAEVVRLPKSRKLRGSLIDQVYPFGWSVYKPHLQALFHESGSDRRASEAGQARQIALPASFRTLPISAFCPFPLSCSSCSSWPSLLMEGDGHEKHEEHEEGEEHELP